MDGAARAERIWRRRRDPYEVLEWTRDVHGDRRASAWGLAREGRGPGAPREAQEYFYVDGELSNKAAPAGASPESKVASSPGSGNVPLKLPLRPAAPRGRHQPWRRQFERTIDSLRELPGRNDDFKPLSRGDHAEVRGPARENALESRVGCVLPGSGGAPAGSQHKRSKQRAAHVLRLRHDGHATATRIARVRGEFRWRLRRSGHQQGTAELR